MRKYLHIHLADHDIRTEDLHGEAIIRSGRHFIAKTLLEMGAASVDPMSSHNPLIFSAGPFAGTNFSNANRLSVGCRSPLTGGIKEANTGGTFGFALGQLEIAGFTLHDASPDWTLIRITKDGQIAFESAQPYLGKGNVEVARMLVETLRQEDQLCDLRPGGRKPRPDGRHLVRRHQPSTLEAGGARGRRRRARLQEGQGHRRRHAQDAALP